MDKFITAKAGFTPVSRFLVLTILLAGLIVAGTSSAAWAAQMNANINPNEDSSTFKVTYQRTMSISYPNGGALFDALSDSEWRVQGTADGSDPGVQDLTQKLNSKLLADQSHAQVQNLNATYDFSLVGRTDSASVDYKVVLEGELANYVITRDSQKALLDLGWRGMTVSDGVTVDGVEINIPAGILRVQEPDAFAILDGTEADKILNRPLIEADFIRDQPLENWHFLFDPTGINVDAAQFKLSDTISGFVVSSWTMGESSIREGRLVEVREGVELVLDQPYSIETIQSPDSANLFIIGFGTINELDGIEIASVTPTAPEGYGETNTGDFPIFIVYGMAGLAAVAGIAFFFVSSRSLKNEAKGQQGIDPSRLVGYQTSSSSGGYQTNRGEAQLRDDSGYQKTRSVYEQQQQSQPEPQQQSQPQQAPPQIAQDDAACGCAASADMGSECDCAMQGSCLCDGTCRCGSDVCKEHVSTMQ